MNRGVTALLRAKSDGQKDGYRVFIRVIRVIRG